MASEDRSAVTIEHRQGDGARGEFVVVHQGARLAELTYRTLPDDVIEIDHTWVSDTLRGRGVARALVDAAVAWARASSRRIAPRCPYARSVFDKDPSIGDVLDH